MTDRLEYYWISGSPYAWRALLALEFKGLNYESKILQSSKQEHKAPAYLAINPRGQVPALRHGDLVLSESLAIMAYLEKVFPEPPMFGNSAADTGRVWGVISDCIYNLERLVQDVIRPIYVGATEPPANWENNLAATHAELAGLEKRLSTANWLALGGLSAADVAVFPFVRSLMRAAEKAGSGPFNVKLLPISKHYPKVSQWVERIEALPYYARTRPPHWG